MELSQRLLACGTEVGALVDQVADDQVPVDSQHQVSCPHCQAALAELEPLWGRVRELTREEVVAPAGLTAAVMRLVRHERPAAKPPTLPLETVVPRLVQHALLHGERGTTRIADSVIAALIARAVAHAPGVRGLRAPGIRRRGLGPAVVVTVDLHRVTASLSLVVELGFVIPEVLAGVRVRAEAAVRDMAGLELAQLDVTVADVVG